MMRNCVLADDFARRTGATWADFAVCCHSANLSWTNRSQCWGDAIGAFRSLSVSDCVLEWNAEEVVETIASLDFRLKDWQTWMRDRYLVSCAW
jgi:hypothetical protein